LQVFGFLGISAAEYGTGTLLDSIAGSLRKGLEIIVLPASLNSRREPFQSSKPAGRRKEMKGSSVLDNGNGNGRGIDREGYYRRRKPLLALAIGS